MSTLSTANSDNTDYPVPVDPNNQEISWEDNPAQLEGLVTATGDFWRRNGHFQTFLNDGAVLMHNGKLAVDSVQAVQLISGRLALDTDFSVSTTK